MKLGSCCIATTEIYESVSGGEWICFAGGVSRFCLIVPAATYSPVS